jgi:biotin carboxyl carrier protein
VILSAMKMETTLAAPYAATVKSVHVSEEQSVVTGEVLVELSGSGT